MQLKLFRFTRGLLGTSLTWGIAWFAFNTAVLFVRWLPAPQEGVSRTDMAWFILKSQSLTALLWGFVFGTLFSVGLAIAARRWPMQNQLRVTRLTAVGAVVGFALPAVVVGFGTLLNASGVVLSCLVGAGIGAALARVARRSPAPISERVHSGRADHVVGASAWATIVI